MCAREGGANTTSLLAAHFAKRNTKFGSGGKIGIGKRGRAKIPSPQPPSFLPARAFSFCRAKRGNQSGFCSKKVRASFSNCDLGMKKGKEAAGFRRRSGELWRTSKPDLGMKKEKRMEKS